MFIIADDVPAQQALRGMAMTVRTRVMLSGGADFRKPCQFTAIGVTLGVRQRFVESVGPDYFGYLTAGSLYNAQYLLRQTGSVTISPTGLRRYRGPGLSYSLQHFTSKAWAHSRRGNKLSARNKEKLGFTREPLPFSVQQLENAGRETRWDVVEKAIDKSITLACDGVNPLRSYAAAIEVCARCGKWRKALEILDDMRGAGVRPDCRAYSSAMWAFDQGGQWDKTLEVWREIQKTHQVTPTVAMYSYVIHAYANSWQSEKAISLLQDMQMKRLIPDVQGFTAAIKAYGRSGRWENAMYLFMEMKALGVTPTAFTYRTVIVAIGKGGQWRKALSLLREMPGVGLAADVKSYNTVMYMCCRNQQWEKGLELFAEMQVEGVKPNAGIYNMAIWAFGHINNWSKVLDTLKEMRAAGVPPGLSSYNYAILAASVAAGYRKEPER